MLNQCIEDRLVENPLLPLPLRPLLPIGNQSHYECLCSGVSLLIVVEEESLHIKPAIGAPRKLGGQILPTEDQAIGHVAHNILKGPDCTLMRKLPHPICPMPIG